MALFASKILCPFCFSEIAKKDLLYRCASASCLESGTNKIHIITKNKPDKNGYCICDLCSKPTQKKVCPKCMNLLPDNILDAETQIISIVGAKGSGKSYYVAAILRQLMEKALLENVTNNPNAAYRISKKWAVKESNVEYDKRFRSRMDNFQPLDGTQLVTNIVKDNPPLLVEMTFSKKNKNTLMTYSFFDAAGESFEDEDILSSITGYIGHSKAVILILDPRQIPMVDSKITSYMSGLPAVSEKTYSDILNNTAQVIRNYKKLKREKKIDIPLCIAFSKWDLLMKTPDLLPEGLTISRQDQQMISGYDDNLINQSSLEIRELLNQWETGLVVSAEQQFETIRYFGFSAWGFADAKETGAPPIASYRVEDPLLWILHRDGMI